MVKSNKFFAFLGMLAIAFTAVTAYAADLRVPAMSGRSSMVTVDQNDNVRNLYTAGGQVIINGNSAKDTVAAGGMVNVNGNTADDLIVAGGNVYVRGDVGGSARVAGGTVTIDGNIHDDLVIAGGNVYVSSHASVGGDLMILAGSAVIDAPVHGNVIAAGGNVTLNNSVGGNVTFRGRYFSLTSKANISGNVDYTSPNVYDRDASAHVGGVVNYHQQTGRAAGGFLFVSLVIKFFAILLAAFVLLWLFRPRFEGLVHDALHNFWKNAAWGILVLIVPPVLAVLLLFTIVGFYISLILVAWYALMLATGFVVAATAFGMWVAGKIASRQYTVGYGSVALALLVTVIILAIPVLGAILMVILVLSGLGTLSKAFRKASSQN